MFKLEAKQVLQVGIQYQPCRFALRGEAFLHSLTLAMINNNGFQFLHHLRRIGNEDDNYSFSINYTISSSYSDLEQVYLSSLKHLVISSSHLLRLQLVFRLPASLS